MEPVLKFVNVNKYYNNNVHALHNINLETAAEKNPLTKTAKTGRDWQAPPAAKTP